MATFKHGLIGAGLKVLATTRLHRVLAPITRGRGAILTFHHVRPWHDQTFSPNRPLEITPEYLDAVLHRLKVTGYRVVPLADVVPRLTDKAPGRFVALTFDDGYRDNLVHALPVLERHAAPFTLFVTTGFADRTARLWWLELESIVRRAEHLKFTLGGRPLTLPARTPGEKRQIFLKLARSLIRQSSLDVEASLAALGGGSRKASRALVEALCLSWDDIGQLAAHPLVTIGCHTLTHPHLAALDRAGLDRELGEAKHMIETRLGRPVPHLAYPYGSPGSAGAREFAAAAAHGFTTAVTTRPGVLSPAFAAHATAMPRISINGLWQSTEALDVLLSGLPFALWNRGHSVNDA